MDSNYWYAGALNLVVALAIVQVRPASSALAARARASAAPTPLSRPRITRAAPIAGTAKNTMHDFLFTEKLVDAIASDPRFNKGFYTSPTEVREGLLRHAKIWAVMGWMFPIVLSLRHSNQICLNDERNLLRMFDISWTQRMLFSFNPINGCISPARTDAATTSRRPDTCHLIPGAMLPNDDNRDFRNLRSVSQVTR